MHYQNMLTALTGFAALAAAVPTSVDRDFTPGQKGLRHKSRAQKRAPLIIEQNINIEPQVTVVEENLGAISQLESIAEQEFAALVQSQVALVSQLETIKNNIRINHFKARFSQVNTVVVTVTNVIDLRDSNRRNKRYMLNQIVVDNGFPGKQNLVMVTDLQEMTIAATPTFDLAGLQIGSASLISAPTAAPGIQNFNSNAPFGAFNGSYLLPFNTSAPQLPANALVLEDPAKIIFPNQNLFIEDASAFAGDCNSFVAQSSSFLNIAEALLYPSIDAALTAQLGALVIGGGQPIIPPNVLANNPQLASQIQIPQPATSTASQATSTVTEAAAGSAPAGSPHALEPALLATQAPAAEPAVVGGAAAPPSTTARVIPTLTAIAGR